MTNHKTYQTPAVAHKINTEITTSRSGHVNVLLRDLIGSCCDAARADEGSERACDIREQIIAEVSALETRLNLISGYAASLRAQVERSISDMLAHQANASLAHYARVPRERNKAARLRDAMRANILDLVSYSAVMQFGEDLDNA